MVTNAKHGWQTGRWAGVRALSLAVACLALLVLFPNVASAQQISSNAYRAAEAFVKSPCFSQISNSNGNATCTSTICGQQVVWNPNNTTLSVPTLGVSLGAFSNEQNAINFFNILGAACGSGAGDGILSTGGSTSGQNAQVENISRAFGNKTSNVSPNYSGGGVAELSSGTYGGSIPLTYGVPLSKDTSFSTVGFVSYANQNGSTNQAALSGSPAYAWQVKDGEGNRIIGVATYLPVSLAFASVRNVPNVLTTWGAGAGAIATGSFALEGMRITYGAGAAFRVVTNANFALPLSVLVRAEQPLEIISPFLTGFVAVSYGNDFLNAGSETWVLGTGASLGKYEFGYRGYYGSGVVAHTFGFSVRKELIGAAVLEREIPEEEKRPTAPPSPTVPAPTSLPPPPEVPPAPPECQTDMECPGDFICEEARCLPPL
jgi:hypothetical protein